MLESPTSKLRTTFAPVATFFCRLPFTWPLVRLTVPAVAMIKVFEPAEITPDVNVIVALMVGLLLSVMPLLLFSVRLLSCVTLLGTLTLLELPPKERLEEEVVDKLVGVPAIVGPFSARLFPATASVPLVNVSVPPTVVVPLASVAPLALLIFKPP